MHPATPASKAEQAPGLSANTSGRRPLPHSDHAAHEVRRVLALDRIRQQPQVRPTQEPLFRRWAEDHPPLSARRTAAV